jgi:hypothetical protein
VDLRGQIALVGLAFFASLFELVLIWDGVCAQLPRTILTIQDEPPTWPGVDDDNGMDLESISDPEKE